MANTIQTFDDCPQLLRDFLFYLLTIRGRSPRTVEGYHVDLRCFFRYLRASRELKGIPEDLSQVSIVDLSPQTICSITLSDAYAFLVYTQGERGNGAKTRARKTSALRSFYKYLHTKTTLLPENPLENLDVPAVKRSLPKYLTLEESQRLLETVASAPHRERDFCIVTLLLNCGMRLSGLVGINLNSINREEHTLRLLGKGNKERIVYLNSACDQAIAAYLAVRQEPAKAEHRGALFLSSRGTRLSPRRVEQLIEGYLQQAGLGGRGLSPHKLRHTAATLMYQYGGVDIRILQDILGHTNLGTTEIYTHISEPQRQDAMKHSPLAHYQPGKGKKD